MRVLNGSWISGFLICCVFLVGNIALYFLNNFIVFPTPENLMQRIQDKSPHVRLRALKDYGFTRKSFSAETQLKIENFFLKKLDPLNSLFEKDTEIRLALYRDIWPLHLQDQTTTIDLLALVLKDPSPECRCYGVKMVEKNKNLQSLPIHEFFFQETEPLVLQQYYAFYQHLKTPLPEEIQIAILKWLPQKTEIHFESSGILTRMVLQEKNPQALELLFSFLNETDSETIKAAQTGLRQIPLEELEWPSVPFRQKILNSQNSDVLAFAVLLLRSNTYANPEEMRTQILRISKEALLSAKSTFAFNLFYILAYHQIWDPSFRSHFEAIHSESNSIIQQFYMSFIEWKCTSNSTAFILMKKLLERLPQIHENAQYLKLFEKPENKEILFYYQIKQGNDNFFEDTKKFDAIISPEFHEILFEESLSQLKKISHYSYNNPNGFYFLLKHLAPQMTPQQLDRFLKTQDQINASLLPIILDILRLAPKTPNAHSFLIRQLQFSSNIQQIEILCALLIKYTETEEMYQKTYQTIQDLTTNTRLGTPLFLEKYLRYLEEQKKE